MQKDLEFVAIDLETTGKYPISAEICEVALIKFNSDRIIDTYTTLVKPKMGMSQTAQGVHGLSLSDLEEAPKIEDVLEKIAVFIDGSSLVGHNIPFDLGFLIYDIEKYKPQMAQHFKAPHFCTSLLSLSLYPKISSHRLQYLTKFFEVQVSPDHRALQDAEACRLVFVELTKDFKSIEEFHQAQGVQLLYQDFSIMQLKKTRPELSVMIEACENKSNFELKYQKGSKKNVWRSVTPKGLVLKEQDKSFLVATDVGDDKKNDVYKRFLLSKITETKHL